ncbi:Uncharacterised protein [Enterobacter cloacae]|nr:Uncharacterised protein [Enterobacter cloacae]
MNHLHIVASTVRPDIGHARLAIFSNGCDFGQDWRDQFICFFLSTRHNGWTFQGALFTAGYTGANEIEAFSRQLTVTTDGVVEEGVAAINNDVAFIQIRFQ